jgi:hypothetical protein
VNRAKVVVHNRVELRSALIETISKRGADSDGLVLIKVLGAFDRAMNMLGQWRRQTVRESLAF